MQGSPFYPLHWPPGPAACNDIGVPGRCGQGPGPERNRSGFNPDGNSPGDQFFVSQTLEPVAECSFQDCQRLLGVIPDLKMAVMRDRHRQGREFAIAVRQGEPDCTGSPVYSISSNVSPRDRTFSTSSGISAIRAATIQHSPALTRSGRLPLVSPGMPVLPFHWRYRSMRKSPLCWKSHVACGCRRSARPNGG